MKFRRDPLTARTQPPPPRAFCGKCGKPGGLSWVEANTRHGGGREGQ